MQEEDTEQAVIDWVNTFNLSKPCSKLSDLSDGEIFIAMLHEVSPAHFDIDSITSIESDNWIVASTNIKRILRMLEEFFRDVLSKYVDVSLVNINGVAKEKDPDEIINLLELIVGAAMFCENRFHFISVISELDPYPQLFLKSLTESFMGRMTDLGGESDAGAGAAKNSFGNAEMAEEFARVEESNRQLREEQAQLLLTIQELEKSNSQLQVEIEKLTFSARESERETTAWGRPDGRNSLSGAAGNNQSELLMSVQMELDATKRDLDLEIVKTEQLRSDFTSEKSKLQRKIDECNEVITKLSMDVQMMSDEVEVARDKGLKLARAEASLEKYQQKIEEMTSLKKQNKELSEKLDQYLDKMHDLETANKALAGYQKKAEEYRERAVKAENETTKATSASAVLSKEVDKLRVDLDSALSKKAAAERECDQLRAEVHRLEDELQTAISEASEAQKGGNTLSKQSSNNLGDIYDGDLAEETIPSLKEKVKKLELELHNYRQSSASGVSSAEASNASTALLEAEIAQLNKIKKEREELFVALQQQLKESQLELNSTNRALKEAEERNRNNNPLREVQRKLDEAVMTVQAYEKHINDKDADIEKLREDKRKLEDYLKKSLTSFKEKFRINLETLRKDKLAQEEKIRMLTEKLEANQETSRREERLLLSAMYELGMKIMDRNFQAQMMDSNTSRQTFLGMQRQTIEGEMSKTPGH